MNHRPAEQSQAILEELNSKFYIVDGELHAYGIPTHPVGKCRSDRYIGFKVNHHLESIAHMPTHRIIYALKHNSIPDIVMLNDSNEYIGIDSNIHSIYLHRKRDHVSPYRDRFMARIVDTKGKRLVRTSKDRTTAHKWIKQRKELYRPIFTKLNLLSYYD